MPGAAKSPPAQSLISTWVDSGDLGDVVRGRESEGWRPSYRRSSLATMRAGLPPNVPRVPEVYRASLAGASRDGWETRRACIYTNEPGGIESATSCLQSRRKTPPFSLIWRTSG